MARPAGFLTDVSLAEAMEIHPALVSRIKNRTLGVSARFIEGALRAFPHKTFDELFYFEQEEVTTENRELTPV